MADRASATSAAEAVAQVPAAEQAPDVPKKQTRYEVAAVHVSGTPAPAQLTKSAVDSAAQPTKKVAIFVAHGMGQQIPFQTLDEIAEGLKKQDAVGNAAVKQKVRAVKFEDQWLRRVELQLRQNANPVEAHIYEGYWAPMTEGKITARGVITFLAGAGHNGIKNGARDFDRWLFGKYERFGSPIRIVLYLLIALATVAALVAMNSTIVAVAAGRALLGNTPAWLTDALFSDLTTTFNGVVAMMVLFAASLGIALGLRKCQAPQWLRNAWGWVTVVLFTMVIFIIVLAGMSIAFLFYGHVKLDAEQAVWPELFSTDAVLAFNAFFDACVLWLMAAIAVGFLGSWIFKIGVGIVRDLGTSKGRSMTLLVTLGLAVFAALAFYLSVGFIRAFDRLDSTPALDIARSGLAWPLLIVASAYIRKVLVQYVGDVAIYVAPYKVDEYYQLRDEIKTRLYKTARAVYAQRQPDGVTPEYERIIIVGHSLGSVIVYDVLNQLVNEDVAAANALNVVERTPLLLTFGSPLDKTAFIFTVQRQSTDEAREALAASVQPLIQDYSFRPARWINIYSAWDIISGKLELYDPPGSRDPKCIENWRDPDASTLLAAHVEYWSNPLLFKTLYQAL